MYFARNKNNKCGIASYASYPLISKLPSTRTTTFRSTTRLTTLSSSTTTQVPMNLIVNIRNFLVFGPGAGDSVLTKADDSTFGPFPISETISYFNLYYSSYYICINGYIKFSSSGARQIYPYNIDLDTRYSGNIFYRRLN